MTPVRHVTRWIAFATSVVAGVTCESPTEPRGVGQRVPVDVTISGRASQQNAQRYSFLVEQDGEYAVFLAASAGVAQLSVLDSQHVQLVAQLSASPTSGPLLSNATPDFLARKGTVLLITIGSQSAIGFEFQVYAVNPAPEVRSASFSIGDTVDGEEIAPVADVDNFSTHGQAGQDIVVVPQPLAPAGAGQLFLLVIDSLSNNPIGYVANDPGNHSLSTTARIRLPSTGEYRFQLRGAEGINSNVGPRYQGPYRFWSYAINRAPEHRSPVLTIGSVVTGERIDRAGDVDEFTFPAAAGAQYNAFIQSSRTVRLEVAPDSGLLFAAALSNPADTGLYGAATGRFTIQQGGGYLVRVYGTASYDLADTGSYRMLLYPVDPRPEHVAATIIPGDTISGESIDVPGDIDEFSVPGAAGDEFNVFFQARTGSASPLRLEVVDSLGLAVGLVQSTVGDTSLPGQSTGRFVLANAGALRIRVTGTTSSTAQDTGAYRLRLYRINRKPETRTDTLVFGDSVSGEAIDVPGDVDEFHVAVPDSSGANLVIQADPGASTAPLEAVLLDSGAHLAAEVVAFNQGTPSQTSTLRIGPGTNTVRIQGYGNPSPFTGSYHLWFYKFSFKPEVAPDTIAIGDTISGETLDPPGDVDGYTFLGRHGDHLRIAFQGQGVPGNGAFFVTESRSGDPPSGFLVCPMLSDSLGACQSSRIDLPETHPYRLSISGASSPTLLSERGPYRFATTRWPTAPEHVAAGIVPGDSVTGEAIDYPWDWDEFTITGTPGQTLAVVTRAATGSGYPVLAVFDSTTGDTLAGTMPQNFDKLTGLFTLPASGHLQLAMYASDFVGAYRFSVVPVNLAPENLPATFAVGDTVRGETIAPIGDIDEFTATGTPGEQLTLLDRLTATSSLDSAIVLEVIDPATGASLVGSNVAIFGSSAFSTVGSFTVPASGTFKVRAHVYGVFGYGVGTTSYEFLVSRP